ncbi:hypothetical protein KAW38_03745 [Candidatus Micrarchaeota archaeon]|nr:hypothetical protein [Candidatus Micrarchaeota archaeon]
MVQKQFRVTPERLKYLRNKFRKTDVLIDRNTKEIIGKRLDFLMILNGHYKINFESAKENRTIMAEVKDRFLAREDGEPVSDRARDDSYLSYEYEDNAKLGILIKDAILQMLRNYRVKELFDEGTIYVPRYSWKKPEVKRKAVKILLRILGKDPRDLTKDDFNDNRLGGLLAHHKGSPYIAIRESYPEVKEWEMKNTPIYFFKKKENRIKATSWLIKKLKKDPKDITRKDFIDNRLTGLLNHYNGSPYLAIKEVHPEIKEWEMKTTPISFYDKKENRVKAIKWLIEKLNKDPRDVTWNDFRDNRLGGLLVGHYKSSPYLAIRDAYPKIKEWEMISTPRSFFDKKENRIKAIKWMIEKLNKNPRDVTGDDFRDNKLGRPLRYHYYNILYLAIKEAYPEIKPEEMRTWVKKTTIEKLQTTA